MKYLFTLLLTTTIAFTYAQKTEIRSVSQFYDINVQGPFKVTLKEGSDNKVSIESDMIPLDEIISDVRSKELTLKLRSRVYLKEKYYDADYIHVTLYYTNLEELKVSMGSIVTVKENLEQDYLRLEASMGGEVRVRANVNDLYGKATMGGIVEISGEARFAEINASMGGEFLAALLKANRADIRSGMGGFVTIQANERLTGSATMGGVIRYTGDPDKKNTSTILGGEIHRAKKRN